MVIALFHLGSLQLLEIKYLRVDFSRGNKIQLDNKREIRKLNKGFVSVGWGWGRIRCPSSTLDKQPPQVLLRWETVTLGVPLSSLPYALGMPPLVSFYSVETNSCNKHLFFTLILFKS